MKAKWHQMKIEDIMAFTAVVRLKSLSRAAESLHLPQSVVTRRIQSFEASLGLQVLDRTTKPLRPSQLGQRVYEQCRSLLEQFDILKGLVASAGHPSGKMRIGVPQFLSESIVVDIVQRLKLKFPELSLEVTSDISPILLESVEGGDLDAAVIVCPRLPTSSARVICDPPLDFDLEVVAAKGDFGRGMHTLRDVYDRGWVVNPGVCGFKHSLEKLLVSEGLPMKVNVDVFGTEVQLGLVANGIGLGLIPARLFRNSSHYTQVERLKLKDFKIQHKLWAVRPAVQGSLTKAVAELAGLVRRSFKA